MERLDVYEILVKEHEAMLHAYALALVRNHALAEEVVQEAFVQAYVKLSSLQNKGAFPAWLRVIAKNIALAELQRNRKEITFDPQVLDGIEDVFVRFDRPEQGDTWQERVTVVERCFKALPEILHTVCKLHYFEERLARDIAGVLRISLSAVLKRLERARHAIRRCVEKNLRLERA